MRWRSRQREQSEARATLAESLRATRFADGTPWVPDGVDIEFLLEAVENLIPLSRRKLRTHTGALPTAEQVASGVLDNMGTCVMASVMCSAWVLSWLTNMISIVAKSYSTCSVLQLHCVKGGSFIDTGECQGVTDCEQFFTVNFIGRLPGFRVVRSAEVVDKGYTRWEWVHDRPKHARPYTVYLIVHHDASRIDVDQLSLNLQPWEDSATAPNLKRVVVLSAPVTDLGGERTDVLLNRKLIEAMDVARQRAKQEGFYRPSKAKSIIQAVGSDGQASAPAVEQATSTTPLGHTQDAK